MMSLSGMHQPQCGKISPPGRAGSSGYVTVIAELASAPIVAPPLLCASIHR